MEYEFKKNTDYNCRLAGSTNIKNKYPDRVPIIVERYRDANLPNIDKSKYLVPKDMTLGQFIYVIRKRIKLESNQALFIWINNGLVTSSKTMMEIYSENKDEDGFLYIDYTNENTFG